MLRVWRSKAYALIPAKKLRGLKSKTTIGVLVGYADNKRGSRIYEPATKQVAERRDVDIDENPDPLPGEVHWGGEAPGGVEAGVRGTVPRDTPTGTRRLSPSSSGESATFGRSPVKAAIGAAQRLTWEVKQEESKEATDTVTKRDLGRARALPSPLGQTNVVGGSANAAEGIPTREIIESLPAASKDTEVARGRPNWPPWKVARNSEQTAMVTNKVWKRKRAPKGCQSYQDECDI